MSSSQSCLVHALVVGWVNLDAQFHHLLANLFTPSDGAYLKEVHCLVPFIGMDHQSFLV